MSGPDRSDVAMVQLDMKGTVMTGQRAGGMIAIGALNIFLGALFLAVGCLMVFSSRFIPFSNAGGVPGDYFMMVGISMSAINLMLIFSGFGVLKGAAWGRTLSVAYAGLGAIIYGGALVATGFDVFFTAALVYSLILMGAFFTPGWKRAFETSPAGTADQSPTIAPAPVAPQPEAEAGEDREAA